MYDVTLSVKNLKDFFSLRKQYLETLVLMIKALLHCQTTSIRKMSLFVKTNTQFDSVYKKLLRFLAKIELCQISVAKYIIHILRLSLDEKQIIAIDRTYWMLGKTNLNFLYLSIIVKGYAVPLFFVICGPNKKGHSSFDERRKLFEFFDAVFSYKNIDYVLADREFMGGTWMRYLQAKGIKFVQRCKEKKLYISNARGEMILASHLYNHLKPGQQIDLGQRRVSKSNSFVANITIVKALDGEIVLLAYSDGIEDPCKAYRTRWKIELCFRSLKSYGFNIEDLSITDPDRVTNLLLVVNIAFALAFCVGDAISNFKPIKIKKHGRRAVCLVTLALQHITFILNQTLIRIFSIGKIIKIVKNSLCGGSR